MKKEERLIARKLRAEGYSLQDIVTTLKVSKSSVSIWVRDVELSEIQKAKLAQKGLQRQAIELRRHNRLRNEFQKREKIITEAQGAIQKVSYKELWLMGVMLYWAEGGKTQRMVRFSNGDPEMIKIMIAFFRRVCYVPESKLHGYIHIHPHLDVKQAEEYWSAISGIPLTQFYKTYNKINKSSQGKKDTLPYGVFDIYIMDVKLFLRITGWARGIFSAY